MKFCGSRRYFLNDPSSPIARLLVTSLARLSSRRRGSGGSGSSWERRGTPRGTCCRCRRLAPRALYRRERRWNMKREREWDRSGPRDPMHLTTSLVLHQTGIDRERSRAQGTPSRPPVRDTCLTRPPPSSPSTHPPFLAGRSVITAIDIRTYMHVYMSIYIYRCVIYIRVTQYTVGTILFLVHSGHSSVRNSAKDFLAGILFECFFS